MGRNNDDDNGIFTAYNNIQHTTASVYPLCLIYIKKTVFCVPLGLVPYTQQAMFVDLIPGVSQCLNSSV